VEDFSVSSTPPELFRLWDEEVDGVRIEAGLADEGREST
jgi:hypothetical protein